MLRSLADGPSITLALMGSCRRMLIRAMDGGRDTLAVDLAPGCLLRMGHASQLAHERGIPKTRRDQPARIGAVFRARAESGPRGAWVLPVPLYPDAWTRSHNCYLHVLPLAYEDIPNLGIAYDPFARTLAFIAR